MCGRYTIALDLEAILKQMSLNLPDFDFTPRYNIAPTQMLPVITNEAPKDLQLMRWGLVPFWAKNPAIGNKMINARGETVAEKPAFRAAFRQRRCLVLVDGFYEWQKSPTGKVPHHIHLKDGILMTFAGLWESWKDGEGKELRSFTILTTTPNAEMAPIHDRMPVIVDPDDRAAWLDTTLPLDEVQELIRPFPDGMLEAVRVGTRVNNPRNEGPELLLDDSPTLF